LPCACSSSIVNPSLAASVMPHTCLAQTRSSCGILGSFLPPLLRESERGFPLESTDVEEALFSEAFRREMEVELRGELAEEEVWRCMDGRISFFCVDFGRISSKSTGTPRETRKARRMRERIQSGG
jgi:hypothetical protein